MKKKINQENKFHYIYKITNLVQEHERYGHFYVGVRSFYLEPELDLEYWGSSKILLEEIKNYGRMNFKKEILFVFETRNEANRKEQEIIHEEFCSREDTYNIWISGKNPKKSNEQRIKNSKNRIWIHNEKMEKYIKKEYLEIFESKGWKIGRHEGTLKKLKKLRREVNVGRKFICNKKMNKEKMIFIDQLETYLQEGWELGRLQISIETRKKRSEKTKGKRWIHNKQTKISTMVKPEDLEYYLNRGWTLGSGKTKN